MARARTSSGKVSLTVRYDELAAAEAKKKITIQATVCHSRGRQNRRRRSGGQHHGVGIARTDDRLTCSCGLQSRACSCIYTPAAGLGAAASASGGV
jgi:hypothetical protein